MFFWCDEEVFKLVRGGDGRILHFKIADCVHCEFHLNKKRSKGPEKVNMEYRMDCKYDKWARLTFLRQQSRWIKIVGSW